MGVPAARSSPAYRVGDNVTRSTITVSPSCSRWTIWQRARSSCSASVEPVRHDIHPLLGDPPATGPRPPAVKLTLTYPAAIGRNVDEVIRVLDALQLSSEHVVSTPVNWNDGEDVIISPAMSDEDASARFPKGFTTLKPYLRLTPQPNR